MNKLTKSLGIAALVASTYAKAECPNELLHKSDFEGSAYVYEDYDPYESLVAFSNLETGVTRETSLTSEGIGYFFIHGRTYGLSQNGAIAIDTDGDSYVDTAMGHREQFVQLGDQCARYRGLDNYDHLLIFELDNGSTREISFDPLTRQSSYQTGQSIHNIKIDKALQITNEEQERKSVLEEEVIVFE